MIDFFICRYKFAILESNPLTFTENSQKPRASKRREAIESVAPYARKRSWDTLSKDHEDLPSDSRSSDFSVDKWGQPANWPRYWRPKVVRGIPEWALAKNYIQYRKCKYIEDIRYVRIVFLKNLMIIYTLVFFIPRGFLGRRSGPASMVHVPNALKGAPVVVWL